MAANDATSLNHEPGSSLVDMEAMRRFGQWWEDYVKNLHDLETSDVNIDRDAT